MNRLQSLSHGAVLVLATGFLLHIGKDVLVPVVFGAIVVYIVIGMTHVLQKIPWLHRLLPIYLRYALSILVIASAFFLIAYLIISNREQVLALAPQYNESLLNTIQKIAVALRIEKEPTWNTLRTDFLARVNIQRLLGSMVFSVSSIAFGIIVILMYSVFLFVECQSFPRKMANLSSDPKIIASIEGIAQKINQKIGAYLMLKTLINMLLGTVSWLIMMFMGLEFAAFWAVLILFFNFIPYIGTFLGLLFPVVMALVQFGDSTQVLWLLLALSLVQFVIGYFLEPYVMGNSLNLSPFAILLCLAIWTELLGITGAFLAVPVTAVLAIIFSEFQGTRTIAVLLSKDGQI